MAARGRVGDAVLNSPHNEWLRLFAEEGFVVGIVGALWIVSTVLTLARVPGWVGAGALATVLGWGVAATFNNPLLFIQVSTVGFTIVGTGLAWGPRWKRPLGGESASAASILQAASASDLRSPASRRLNQRPGPLHSAPVSSAPADDVRRR
jgi:hypothetical protein